MAKLSTRVNERDWPQLPVGIQIHPTLFTAGQPSEVQFAEVAQADCHSVINLALATSTNALPDERTVVTKLGIEYLHLPVNFEQPTVADYLACESALRTRQDRRTLLHCALNWRVSSFMAAYRVRNLDWTEADAWDAVRQIWEPDEVWRPLITRLMAERPR